MGHRDKIVTSKMRIKSLFYLLALALFSSSVIGAETNGLKILAQDGGVWFGPNGDVAIRRYGEAAVIQGEKLILPAEVSVGKVTLKQFIEATIRADLKKTHKD